MSKNATKASWKTLAHPTARESLGYDYVFDDADADQLRVGLIPQRCSDMMWRFLLGFVMLQTVQRVCTNNTWLAETTRRTSSDEKTDTDKGA